jgi:hypothetical protein
MFSVDTEMRLHDLYAAWLGVDLVPYTFIELYQTSMMEVCPAKKISARFVVLRGTTK